MHLVLQECLHSGERGPHCRHTAGLQLVSQGPRKEKRDRIVPKTGECFCLCCDVGREQLDEDFIQGVADFSMLFKAERCNTCVMIVSHSMARSVT